MKAPLGRLVRIHQFTYSLGKYEEKCPNDRLEIYDGKGGDTQEIIYKLCGRGDIEVTESKSNIVVLKFFSDDVMSELDVGFKIKYSISCKI